MGLKFRMMLIFWLPALTMMLIFCCVALFSANNTIGQFAAQSSQLEAHGSKRIHRQSFHQQKEMIAEIRKDFMRIIWTHCLVKLKRKLGNRKSNVCVCIPAETSKITKNCRPRTAD